MNSIGSASSPEIAQFLLDEYTEILDRFAVGDHRPGELSGGRFAEAALRVCQHRCRIAVTPVGKSLPRIDALLVALENSDPKAVDDGFRLHIPRVLRSIYDFRNKRDIAHIANTVSPNIADSALVVATASWVLCEIVRLCHQCSTTDAQRIVDSLADRKIPVVWDNGDVIRVLDNEMSFADKTLVVLYHLDPDHPSATRLFKAVEYSRIDHYKRNVLTKLHNKAHIDYRDDRVIILPPGKKRVEELLSKRV